MAEYHRKKAILDKIHHRRTPPSAEEYENEQKLAQDARQQQQPDLRTLEMENDIIERRQKSNVTLPPISQTYKHSKSFEEDEKLIQDSESLLLQNSNFSVNKLGESITNYEYDLGTIRSQSLNRESAGTQTDETRIADLKNSLKSKSTANLTNPSETSQKKKERPKWGIVPPKVQYIKQSEKDPNFQLRQKMRKDRMKRREEQLKHVTTIDTESEDGRQGTKAKNTATTKPQPLKVSHTLKSSMNPRPSTQVPVTEEVCHQETTYYTTTIKPEAYYVSSNKTTQSKSEVSSNKNKYKHLTQQERLLLQAYENDESCESSQLSSSPASIEKEMDFQRESIKSSSVHEMEERISRKSRSETKKYTKLSQESTTIESKTIQSSNKNTNISKRQTETIIPIVRSNSPPVPALLKKMQLEQKLIPDAVAGEAEVATGIPPNPSPPVPDFIRKLGDEPISDTESFLSDPNSSEIEHEFQTQVQTSKTKTGDRIKSNKSKISTNTHIIDVPMSDYEKIPHIPDVSPRYLTHNQFLLDSEPFSLSPRPITRESELSQREKIISYVMHNEDVQAELSARESELSSKGIIEFSIKLPPQHAKHSKTYGLQVSEEIKSLKKEKTVISGNNKKEEGYLDPLESVRRRATINWVNAKENGRGDLLTHLSQLKQVLPQDQILFHLFFCISLIVN